MATVKALLPCSACLAGKMKKTRKTPTTGYTEVTNLAVSWTPGTDKRISTPNELVSLDWGIINKKNQANVKNVFAIYLDNHTGLVFFIPLKAKGRLALPYRPSSKDTAYLKQLSTTMHRNLSVASLPKYVPTNQYNNHPLHRTTTIKTRPKNTSTSLPPWLDASYSSPVSIRPHIGSTPFNTPSRSKFAVP
jgi:hypothetical protein